MLRIFPEIQIRILKALASLAACAPSKSGGSSNDSADTASDTIRDHPMTNQDMYTLVSPPTVCGTDSSPESTYARDCAALRALEKNRFGDTLRHLSSSATPEALERGDLSYEFVIRLVSFTDDASVMSLEIALNPDCPFEPDHIFNFAPVTSCRQTYGALLLIPHKDTLSGFHSDGWATAALDFNDEKMTSFTVGDKGGVIGNSIMANQRYYVESDSGAQSTSGLVDRYTGLEGVEKKVECFEPECNCEEAGEATSDKTEIFNRFLLWLAAQKVEEDEGEGGDGLISVDELNHIYAYDGYQIHLKGEEYPTARTSASSQAESPTAISVTPDGVIRIVY